METKERTIFDVIIEREQQGQPLSQNIEEYSKETEVPWYKSWPSAAAKGFVEGVASLGKAFSGDLDPYQSELEKKQRAATLEELLPTNEGFASGTIEKGTKAITEVGGGRGALQTLIRGAGAGLASQTAEEMGGGETAQAVAQLPFTMAPDIGGKIVPKRILSGKTAEKIEQVLGSALPARVKNAIGTAREEQELAKFARLQGLDFNEFMLMLNRRGILKDAAVDVSSKGRKTVERFSQAKKGLDRVWEGISTRESAKKALSGEDFSQFMKEVNNTSSKLPDAQRKLIAEDLNDLIRSNATGADLINFWQDLNYHIRKGEGALGQYKGPIEKALIKLDPELAKDFKLTNKLHGNFADLAYRMSPDLAEHLFKKGESGALLVGVATGNSGIFQKVLGTVGGRAFAREIVTNPKIQNLASRWLSTAQRGLPKAAEKLYNSLVSEVAKESQEAARELAQLDMKSFIEEYTKYRSSLKEDEGE